MMNKMKKRLGIAIILSMLASVFTMPASYAQEWEVPALLETDLATTDEGGVESATPAAPLSEETNESSIAASQSMASEVAADAAATVHAYAQSPKYAVSTNYTLKVNGVAVPVIQAYDDYDYANFSVSEGKVTYELTILNTDKVHEYAISPKKLGITPTKIEGRTLTFTTDKDEYLIVMMNGRKKRMVIAADPVETDVPSSTGTGIFNVTQAPYGVSPAGEQTGVAVRTAAIQQAIDDASQYGTEQGSDAQGIVYVPAGTYYIGNLVLKSNTALYMAPGATFVGSGKTADYTEHWFKDSMGRPATWWISTAFDSSNIKLYGRGTIDGNGRALHDDKSTNGKGMINNLVVPIATEHFDMDGIIIRESAAWAVMPVRSNDLTFTNLKMFNSLGMGENDGIDIVESQNAIIRNSIGIALDDPYSTKAWKEDTDIASGIVPWPGNPEPVENVLFEDAISWTLCYGYKIGQGVMQDQRNITFRNAVVYKAAVGFAVHHKYGLGKVSDVTFENIDVEDISGKNDDNSAWMTMFTVDSGGNGVGPVTGVTVKDITVRDVGESFSKLKGAPGAMISNITFENVYMPGLAQPAATLHEMNFLSKDFYSNVIIKPLQNPEPRPRTNLALRQPAVSSSQDAAENTTPYAFDGNLTTRFGSKRGVDPGWIYVDLGSVRTINRVHLLWEAAYGKSYKIQISDDPSDEAAWQDVYSTTTGKGGLEEIGFDEVDARYVRMLGLSRATQYGYSLWEMEVYGPEVFVDSISLIAEQLELVLGNKGKLEASLLPENATNRNVSWSSSNPTVATVNGSGEVTAAATGTAIITARTQNGELSASAAVTVLEEADLEAVLPDDRNIGYIGRWDTSRQDGYVSNWPGAYFRTVFTGSKIQLKVKDTASFYVRIDDGEYRLFENASGTINLASSSLTDGEHTLTVVAKDITDRVSFGGLLLEKGAVTMPASTRENLIEFVGDSITVGYRTPDVALDSYAWLTGESLAADHTQVAYTGICLQSGIQCYAPNALGMSEQYFKQQTGDYPDSPEWDFGRYQPEAVVLNLGTNDAKFHVDDETFSDTYTKFLADIRSKYPDTQLLVLRTFGGFMADATLAAVTNRIEAGDKKIHYIDTTGWLASYPSPDFIDDLHPSRSGHEKIADQLAPLLAAYLEAPEEKHPPGAPTGITAEAGNGEATLRFLAPESDGGSPITGYKVTTAPGGAVTEGTSSPIRITGLNNGTAYTFSVQAINENGVGAASVISNPVTPAAPSQGGGDTGYIPSLPEQSQEHKAVVSVNGKSVQAGKLEERVVDSRRSVKVQLSEDLLSNLTSEDTEQPVIKIELHSVDGKKADTVIGEISNPAIDLLHEQKAVLELSTGEAIYRLPLDAIDLAAILEQAGESADSSKLKLQIIISQPSADMLRLAAEAAAQGENQMIGSPVEFSVQIFNGDTSIEQFEFGVYIERTIILPEGTDESGTLTGVVLEEDGSVRPVPTRMERIEGKLYAIISSRANSVYSVIHAPARFLDMEGHWADTVVAEMGSRLIVMGTEDGSFLPNEAISRAEFAAMLVRSLGLKPDNVETPFRDVASDAWYHDAVSTSSAHGLIAGFEDGTFRPYEAITREQAMVMLAKAMRITGLNQSVPEEAAAALMNKFKDRDEISAWAQASVTENLLAGIALGRGESLLVPGAAVTRAETVVMLHRLLKKSGLIS